MTETKAGPATARDQKAFRLEIKEMDERGTFTGYANTFDLKDWHGDVVERGAFKRTLDHHLAAGKKIKLLWQHDVTEPIGYIEEAAEDDKGLKVRGKLLMELGKARETWILMKAGVIDSMSIGYDVIKDEFDRVNNVRRLKELRLWEISLVTFPANEDSTVTSVKAATPFGDLPLAARGRAWDSTAAEGRVRTWAGATDGPNAKYRKAFVWYDAANADNFGAYKLQIADVINGELTAVPRGVFAAAAVVSGARGGVDIPAADVASVKRHLGRYYAKMASEFSDDSIVAPWDKPKAKAMDFVQTLQNEQAERDLNERRWEIWYAICEANDSALMDPDLTTDEKLTQIETNLRQFSAAYLDWARTALESGLLEMKGYKPDGAKLRAAFGKATPSNGGQPADPAGAPSVGTVTPGPGKAAVDELRQLVGSIKRDDDQQEAKSLIAGMISLK